MKNIENINPFTDIVFIEKNGRLFRLHWKYRYGPLLLPAIVAGGIGMSVYGTLEEGKMAATMGKIAQQQYKAEAKATEEAGVYESREKRKEAQRAKASQIAQMMAQGGTLTGSNLSILADTAAEYEADARVIMHNYQTEAIRLRNLGRIARYEGQQARYASRIRAMTQILNPVATILSGSNFGNKTSAFFSGVPYSSARTVTGRTPSGGYVFG